MATHNTRIDRSMGPQAHQVFTNNTGVTGAVTFATGDYIDFKEALGRPAKRVQIILVGAVSVQLKFNTRLTLSKHEETQANTTVEVTEGVSGQGTLPLVCVASDMRIFETPEGFPVDNIKIVSYTGVAAADLNLTIIGF